MSDEELRPKVAKLCGWEFAPRNGPLDLPWRNTKLPAWDGNIWSGRASDPPDYPNDLNAMAEAEKVLTPKQAVEYRLRLSFNSDGPTAAFPTVEAAMCHATARQRAEAFVKTLTK